MALMSMEDEFLKKARQSLEMYVPRNPQSEKAKYLDPVAQNVERLHRRQNREIRTLVLGLRTSAQRFAKLHGLPEPSDLLVATGYFDHGVSKLLQGETVRSIIANQQARFIVLYDASQGASALNRRLSLAEEQFYQRSEPGIARTLADAGGDQLLAGQIFEHATQDLSSMVDQLTKDRSGFGLVDDFIAKLKANPDVPLLPYGPISPEAIPEFFTAGAELWGSVYKRVYNILQSTPRQR